MKKLFAKHPNLRLLLLALVATGLLAFALALKAAQSKVSFYDAFFPKKKPATVSSNSDNPPPPTTTQPTPAPTSRTTSEGKSLGDTSAQAPTSTGLTITLTHASSAEGGTVAAITNMAANGTCTFSFSNNTSEQSTLIDTHKGYSACSVSGKDHGGQNVSVSVTSDMGNAASTTSMKVD